MNRLGGVPARRTSLAQRFACPDSNACSCSHGGQAIRAGGEGVNIRRKPGRDGYETESPDSQTVDPLLSSVPPDSGAVCLQRKRLGNVTSRQNDCRAEVRARLRRNDTAPTRPYLLQVMNFWSVRKTMWEVSVAGRSSDLIVARRTSAASPPQRHNTAVAFHPGPYCLASVELCPEPWGRWWATSCRPSLWLR